MVMSGEAFHTKLFTEEIEDPPVEDPPVVENVMRKPRVMWADDDDIFECGMCRTPFNLLIRQHHCRRCGRIFCADCAKYKCLIPPEDVALPPVGSSHMDELDPCAPQRVCIPCAQWVIPFQSELRLTNAQVVQNATTPHPSNFAWYKNLSLEYSMQDEINKAVETVKSFQEDMLHGAGSAEMLHNAAGLAFLTLTRAGIFFSGRMGVGIMVGRRQDGGWSAPTAIMTMGFGWGTAQQVVGEVTDTMLILNSREALDNLASSAQLIHSGNEGEQMVTYSTRSKGLDLDVQTGIILVRADLNNSFYGAEYSANDLLQGVISRPCEAESLYAALVDAEDGVDPSPTTLPGYRQTTVLDRPLVAGSKDAWTQERSRRLSKEDAAPKKTMIHEMRTLRSNSTGALPSLPSLQSKPSHMASSSSCASMPSDIEGTD